MVPASTAVRVALAVSLAFGVGTAASVAAGELRGAGATFPSNLYFAWIDAFREVNPDIDVRYESVGSGEGIRRFLADEVDFGASDRALTDEQIEAAPEGVVHVPATAGMVVITYNIPGYEGDLRLSRTALAGIFSGEIRYWDDPLIQSTNPDAEFPHRSIALVARRDGSGTTFALTSHLDTISDIWRITGRQPSLLVDWPGPTMMVPGNDGVAGRIAISQYSIGYVEYSFARLLNMPTAAIENNSGAFVKPSAESGAAALASAASEMPQDGRQVILDPEGPDAYPIVSYSWLLLKETYEPQVSADIREFVEWGLTEGQAMADPIGYIPLPEPAAERALALLDEAG